MDCVDLLRRSSQRIEDFLVSVQPHVSKVDAVLTSLLEVEKCVDQVGATLKCAGATTLAAVDCRNCACGVERERYRENLLRLQSQLRSMTKLLESERTNLAGERAILAAARPWVQYIHAIPSESRVAICR